ncbi:Heparinase II/III-like protein [Chitinispirillum alkaliphilum]|nr:Heparinase II/III-like protein [Chitinispirillum alkaliphilum]
MNISHYYQTIRFLKPVQIIYRLRNLARFGHKTSVPALSIRRINKSPCSFILKPDTCLSHDRFKFLNCEREILFPSGWNDPQAEKLWLYNLHYFDFLNSSLELETGKKLITSWIEDNPPTEGNGWEPYPVSLRAVNWIKWHLCTNQLANSTLKSLAMQVQHLSHNLEYHLLANHLLANAKALVFAGLFFEGKAADQWLKKGIKILEKEIPEQLLNDGGNFERSPMYHCIMIEDILDIINLSRCYSHPLITENLSNEWLEKAGKGLDWLKAMCHGDGNIALFNDAAFGIAPQYRDLAQYAARSGITPDDHLPKKGVTNLSDTGYIRIETDSYTMIFDAGEIGPAYQPGHAHADTLSFEFSSGKERIIVDSGTSCYGSGHERLRQRSTSAHNTVSVDGKNSSEVWSGFRVAKRAQIVEYAIEEDGKSYILKAAHNGFKRLNNVGLHRRKITARRNTVIIEDIIEGRDQHLVEAFLHFHPDVEVKPIGEKKYQAVTNSGKQIKIFSDLAVDNKLERATFHPEFGVALGCSKVTFSSRAKLPFTFTTTIEI